MTCAPRSRRGATRSGRVCRRNAILPKPMASAGPSCAKKLLLAVIDKFFGGPVGLDNLAAAIGEERETIEDVLEPYLIQQGFLQRTPRGRMATVRAWNHFGITPPEMP